MKNSSKRLTRLILLPAVIIVTFSGCASETTDPYADARYKTMDKKISTQPWARQEKWQQGGAMGNFQDPRYQQY